MSKKKHPWHKSYSGKERRKTPPQKAPATRRVFVTLELDTQASLSELRRADFWDLAWYGRVLQVQANVARPEK